MAKLQLSKAVFRPALVDPGVPVREIPKVSFADMVRMMAEGIAAAQLSLDRASAELVKELAETRVEIVPRVTETVDADGNVTYAHSPPQEVSLLDIGVTPTFYQFSEATIEVTMDVSFEETESEKGTRSYGLFAKTSDVKFERKLNREVKASSKLTAKMVPVPRPLNLEPIRTTETKNS